MPMLLLQPPRPRPVRLIGPNGCSAVLDRLARQPLQIAVDTEFEQLHTLTIQLATRVDNALIAKVYRSKSIPCPTDRFDVRRYLLQDKYDRFFENLWLRCAGTIKPSLSPGRMLKDLYGVHEADCLSRQEGLKRLSDKFDGPANREWCKRRGRWVVPAITLQLIGHFLPADFARIFGRDFYADLLDPTVDRPVSIRMEKYSASRKRPVRITASAPVVEFLVDFDDNMYEVRLETRDLACPYGKASLEKHSQTFLGLSKCEAISNAQKSSMEQTFREHTDDAYGYAITDSVNTLLVHEQMNAEHRRTFTLFGCPADDIPVMRPTLGSRVVDFTISATRRSAAANSKVLSSNAALRRQMSGGGIAGFEGASHFGTQIVRSHGGLLFSRMPSCLYQEAIGMFRDVDMAGCYNHIISKLTVYWGKPIVFEPGEARMSLANAIKLGQRLSPPDGWFVRVTGDIKFAPNTLIPSTLNAVTSENYRQQRRRGLERADAEEHSKLFSQRIESGIVTDATWRVIQALPEPLRAEYESLTADTIVLYPRSLIAEDGEHFDRLLEEKQRTDLPWNCYLDLEPEQMALTEIKKINHDFVSLRFHIGGHATRIGELRKQAQQQFGKGSGQDANLKATANTMYGTLASPHFPTQNVMAANQITATGRAAAFMMVNSLNGLQVITDGCSYRRDRIPDCTFDECLQIMPDYPLRHADENSGIPFIDPEAIPSDDAGFTEWYRGHVKRFFGVSGGELDAVVALHNLEHKLTGETGTPAFDAIACSGAGDYLKCVRQPDGSLLVEDAALRGFGHESKETLIPWIVATYSADEMTELPPVAEDTCLLKHDDARRMVAKARKRGIESAFLPLGLPLKQIRNFRVIKASTFVFQTPEQYRAFHKQAEKFKAVHQCGLELIAFRRGYAGVKTGSLNPLQADLRFDPGGGA